jgi:hypothetical protein
MGNGYKVDEFIDDQPLVELEAIQWDGSQAGFYSMMFEFGLKPGRNDNEYVDKENWVVSYQGDYLRYKSLKIEPNQYMVKLSDDSYSVRDDSENGFIIPEEME